MRAIRSALVLTFAAFTAASAATAKDYAYTAPASPRVIEALQTPDKTPDTSTYPNFHKRDNLEAIDTTPGLIRPATRPWLSHNDDNRGFVCADKKCKTSVPVYNTRTPLEREQNSLANN